MINLYYINKAWLTIYCKQMLNLPKEEAPELLLVAKNSDELEKIYEIWKKVRQEVTGYPYTELPCFGMTEDNLRKNYMDKEKRLVPFTDCLISQNVHDCLLKNYIIQNLRRNKNDKNSLFLR